MKATVRYSETFKRRVVDEIAGGKFSSLGAVRRAYGINGRSTLQKWIRTYGREDLLPKMVKVVSMNEQDELKTAKRRIRELEAALADAHIDHCLEHAFLEIACERMAVPLDEFKKKNAVSLSDVRRIRGRK